MLSSIAMPLPLLGYRLASGLYLTEKSEKEFLKVW